MTDEIARGQRRPSEQDAFDRLLALLHEDREKAGEEYELLRMKLRDFFALRHCRHPEELADVTLNRLAQKLASGTEVEHVGRYAFGIAHKVLLEGLRADGREASTGENFSEPSVGFHDALDANVKKRCLSECLSQLSDYDCRLFIAYNCAEDKPNKLARKDLAERENMSSTALRIRIHRMRDKLLPCMEDCLQRGPKNMKHSAG
jgi:DNA-directed RNA polymerase specialized sigma24 family protein